MKKGIFIFVQLVGLITFIGTVFIFGQTNSNGNQKLQVGQKNNLILIYDGRLFESPQISAADKSFVEREVRSNEKIIREISESADFKCDSDSFAVAGSATGSFTKPKSLQKAFLYQLCFQGQSQYATYLGGIIITENGKIIDHQIFTDISGYHGIKSLPDVNKNGLSEIVLNFDHSINSLNFTRAVGIYEFKSNKLINLANFDTFIRADNDTSSKVFVKPAKQPKFYQENYQSEVDENKWKQSEKLQLIENYKADEKVSFKKLSNFAPNAPTLTIEDLSNRVFKLIKSINGIKDLSPENIERQMEIKVLFNDENPKEYGFGGNITNSANWSYNLFAYPYPSKNNKITDTLRFSFDSPKKDADLKEVCINIDNFQQKLKDEGFKFSRYSYSVHSVTNGLSLERNNVSVEIFTNRYSKNFDEIKNKCVKQILISVLNNKK